MSCSKPVLPAGLHDALTTLGEKYVATWQIEDDAQIVLMKDNVIEECMKHKYDYNGMVRHPNPKTDGG